MRTRDTTVKKTKTASKEEKAAGSPSPPTNARIQELDDWQGEMLARIELNKKQVARIFEMFDCPPSKSIAAIRKLLP